MNDCLFCKIIAGDIPATKVYEDDATFAFLDIAPINQGHTLVIPKKHTVNIYDIDESEWGKVMNTTKKLSYPIKKALEADGINIEMNNDAIAGQKIFHAHVHIIPRLDGDGLHHWPGAKHYGAEHLEIVAEKIKKSLS